MKKLEVFCIFGISTHLVFLGSNFSFWFSFFYHFFFIPKLFFIFFSFVFRILTNHCPFFIISIHFSSFSLLFPWISCVLQHFSTKKWGKSDEHSAKSKDSGNMTQKWKNKWKKMIKKWKINEKNSRFFAFLGFQLIWFFLAPIFHFGFHFFIIFFSFPNYFSFFFICFSYFD